MKEFAIEMIKKHEGFSKTVYKDTVGKLTIGFGRNLTDRGISEKEAEILLDSDIDECIEKLSFSMLTKNIFNSLDDARKSVLIDMCYNIGYYGILKFENMLCALKDHNYDLASKEMLNSKWAEQTKNRAIDLSKIMLAGKIDF